tara:strand:+ start:291 stop:1709 length:1419 start_codon:yes stop_codon:yes gene_type:complete
MLNKLLDFGLKGFKKYSLIILLSPIFLNSTINILSNVNLLQIINNNLLNLFSFFLAAIFYYYLSSSIKQLFNLNSMSLSIVFFFTSFFIIDLVFLPITKLFSFSNTFYFTVSLWIITFLTKFKNIKIIFMIISYFCLRLFNYIYIDNLHLKNEYIELNTDVSLQWLPLAKIIYENNFFFGLENNLIEGQGLFLSYIQSLIHLLNFHTEEFLFFNLNSNIFILFGILLIFDLQIDYKNKIFSSFVLILLLFNNDWLYYLLVNSLMLEGLVSFFIAVYIFNFVKYKELGAKFSNLFYLFFGTMALTKQFVSLTFLLFCLTGLIIYKNRINFLVAFIPFTLNNIYQFIYLRKTNYVTYTNDLDYVDLFLDILFFRDLNLHNIYLIIRNFWIDKPTSLIFIYFFLFLLFNVLVNNKNTEIYYLKNFFIIVNIFLVFILYISYWQNIELESSYRYILNMFYLIYIGLISDLDSFEKI